MVNVNSEIPTTPLNGKETYGRGIATEGELSPEADAFVCNANSLFEMGDFAAASDSMKRAVALAPGSSSLLASLGATQFQLCNYGEAFLSFERANELNPDDAGVLVQLAISAANCGKTEEFERAMARGLELDPENGSALMFLGKLNQNEGNFTEAAKQFRHAIRQFPEDVQLHLDAGACYFEADDFVSSRKMFEKALLLDPENAVAKRRVREFQTPRVLFQPMQPAAMPKHVASTSPSDDEFKKLIDQIKKDQVGRPHYANGLLLATLQAQKIGLKEISVFEFGVLRGDGLLDLCATCAKITEATGFKFRIYGFDSDVGMPEITDYRDHPEIWYTGQFQVDHNLLIGRLPPNAKLIVGDIAKTIVPFCKENLSPECPVGFVSIDVDLYSSTKSAFHLFTGAPECYLPAVVMYFDDVNDMITLNSWAGEALAIREFNEENQLRKIEEKWTRQNSCNAGWHDQMYCCHVLDHPVRSGKLKCASLDLNVTIY
jgi:Flp pilus assembly protein TadD